jgi:Flp pilus assembly pilin Flp
MTAIGNCFRQVLRDRSGATAVEFALVAPAYLALLLGVLWLSLLMFTYASLHYTVEESARCASIRTNCPDPSARYYGLLGDAAVFTVVPNQPCGTRVTGSVTFQLNVVLHNSSIPLTASSCFP